LGVWQQQSLHSVTQQSDEQLLPRENNGDPNILRTNTLVFFFHLQKQIMILKD